MTTMRTSAAGRKAIAQREGNKLTAYKDSAGIPTIGVGHTSAAGPPAVKMGMKITAKQSDEILTRDLQAVETDVNRLVKVPLTQSQFDALVSLVFNIGGTAFRKSTLLKRLNASDYVGAAQQFRVWNKARVNGKKVALKGLTTRREAERKQFLSGTRNASPDVPAAETVASDIYTDRTTVEIVQRRLYELGYTEVGSRRADGSFDGKIGDMTKAAILAFRNDNSLPVADVIDRQLLDALDAAPKRKLARNDAPAEVVRDQVPEVKANWRLKVGAMIGGAVSALGALFDGVVSNLGLARGYLGDFAEYVGDLPGWVKLGVLVLVAGGIYYVAHRGEARGIEAFREGARR